MVYAISYFFPREILEKVVEQEFYVDESSSIAVNEQGMCPLGAAIYEMYGDLDVLCPTPFLVSASLCDLHLVHHHLSGLAESYASEFTEAWDSGEIDDLEVAFGLK